MEQWQENYEQLIRYDNALAEKDKEIHILREQLQVTELELARLKLSRLGEPAVEIPKIARDEMFRESLLQDLDFPFTQASSLSKQRGQTFVPITTSADSLPLVQVITTTTTTSSAESKQRGQTFVPITTSADWDKQLQRRP